MTRLPISGPDQRAPTARFDWEQQSIYQEYLKDMQSRGAFFGQHDPLGVMLWFKRKFFANISPGVKSGLAMSHVTQLESVRKPRQMGWADRDYTTGKVVWADEVIVYRKPDGSFHNWWEAGSPSNVPPKGKFGYKEGEDYIIQEVPLDQEQLDEKTIEHFLSVVPKKDQDGSILSMERLREMAERRARDDMWEMVAKKYVGMIAFRFSRGEIEAWAQTFEPAVFLVQKAKSGPEPMFPDERKAFIDQARQEIAQAQQELARTPESEKEKREELKETIKWYQGHLSQLESKIDDESLIKLVGPQWKEKKVVSLFSTFHAVGRLLLQELAGPTYSKAIMRSRRLQQRMIRIAGLEIAPGEGGFNVEYVHYGRMSEMLDYNEDLLNVILNRAGLDEDAELLHKIQMRLNAYRTYLGLPIVELDPDIEGRIHEEREKRKKLKKERGGTNEEEKERVERKGPGGAERERPEEGEEGPAEARRAGRAPAEQEQFYKRAWEEKIQEFQLKTPPMDWKKSKNDWRALPNDLLRIDRWERYLLSQGKTERDIDSDLMKETEKFWSRYSEYNVPPSDENEN